MCVYGLYGCASEFRKKRRETHTGKRCCTYLTLIAGGRQAGGCWSLAYVPPLLLLRPPPARPSRTQAGCCIPHLRTAGCCTPHLRMAGCLHPAFLCRATPSPCMPTLHAHPACSPCMPTLHAHPACSPCMLTLHAHPHPAGQHPHPACPMLVQVPGQLDGRGLAWSW